MSRWFRHYAGMMRDEKLVRVAVKAKQPVERVVWVWGAILESAAEVDEAGQFEIDAGAIAYWLHVEAEDIETILDELHADQIIDGNTVADWDAFSRHCTRLPWSEWAVIRLSVFQRDNFTCQYCGASGVPLDCDHVFPLSRGGTNEKSNLKTSCKPCNQSKGDKLLEDWRAA